MGSQERPITRRQYVQLSGAGSAFVLAGCLGDGDSDGDDGGTSDGDDGGGGEEQYVEVGLSSSVRTLDPIRYLSTPDRQILNNAFHPIVGIDTDLEFYPALAASMPETERDGQRWIVEIDPDAQFQNGDPVTLDDVRYTVDQPFAEERGSTGDFDMIDERSFDLSSMNSDRTRSSRRNRGHREHGHLRLTLRCLREPTLGSTDTSATEEGRAINAR